MRLIDANALVESILEERAKIPFMVPAAPYELVKEKPYQHGNSMRGGIRKALRCVANAPTVEAAPVVHGRWDGTADGYWNGELVYDIWNCSNCGFDADGADEKPDWNYCPHCGAKMDLWGGGNADNND